MNFGIKLKEHELLFWLIVYHRKFIIYFLCCKNCNILWIWIIIYLYSITASCTHIRYIPAPVQHSFQDKDKKVLTKFLNEKDHKKREKTMALKLNICHTRACCTVKNWPWTPSTIKSSLLLSTSFIYWPPS